MREQVEIQGDFIFFGPKTRETSRKIHCFGQQWTCCTEIRPLNCLYHVKQSISHTSKGMLIC